MEALLAKFNITKELSHLLCKKGRLLKRETLYAILYDGNNDNLSDTSINDYLYNDDAFKEAVAEIERENEFLENPFVVVEGGIECSKCGSKRVYSFQKQTRSCDEPSTTFNTCVNCKSKWIYN